jgi:hypothetical protein
MEVGVIKFLKFDNIIKVLSILPDSLDKIKDINKLKESIKLSNSELSECIDLLTYEDLEDYYKTDYFGKELRDDFGMIQNVMRSDPKEDEEKINDEDIEFNIPSLGLPFDFNEDNEIDEL